MKAHHVLLLSGLTLVFCAPLDAQRKRKGKGKGGTNVTKIFERLDKNKDGKITAAEAEGSRIAKAFAKIDTAKDGAITKTELAASSSGKGKGRKGKRRKGKRRKGGGKGN